MKAWKNGGREVLERELLQDFCLVRRDWLEQFVRFEQTQTISFSIMHSLVGTNTMKGLLWRVKDNAHILFGDKEHGTYGGNLLDWVLGYIFHEAIKLKEDTYLEDTYLPGLADTMDKDEQGQLWPIIALLITMREQTPVSATREIYRLEGLMRCAQRLFCEYFAGRSDHRPLARFLYDRNDLVRHIFKEDYELLLNMVYEDLPERMYLEAAASLLESVRPEEAQQALKKARIVARAGLKSDRTKPSLHFS